MKTATTKQLRAAVAKYGATIDESTNRGGFWNIDAPKGKVWGSSFNHAIHVQFENSGGQSFKGWAFARAIEDMSMGLVDCNEGDDCECCHPLPEETEATQ